MQDCPKVILTSFSQRVLRRLLLECRAEFPPDLSIIDAERDIAQSLGYTHLIHVFMDHGVDAFEMICDAEMNFIDTAIENDKDERPAIIGLRPTLLVFDQWPNLTMSPILKMVNLQMSTQAAFRDLKKKREEDRKIVNSRHRNFGIWDRELLTVGTANGYMLYDEKTSIRNITNKLALFNKLPQLQGALTMDAWDVLEDRLHLGVLKNRIADTLGLTLKA